MKRYKTTMGEMMGEELTLEKLKIDERLRSIEQQVTRLVAHSESEAGNIATLMSSHTKAFEEHKDDFKEHKKEDDTNFKRIDKTIYLATGIVSAVVFVVRVIWK